MTKNLTKQNFLSEVFDKYYAELYNFILSRTGYHKEIAEDLIQDVMLKIWDNLENYNSNKASVRTWIYRITRNHIIDWYRKNRSSNKPINLNNTEITDLTFSENQDKDLLLKEMLRKIRKLSDNDQELLYMRYTLELSNIEISEILGKSEVSVKVAIFRAIEKLRKILND